MTSPQSLVVRTFTDRAEGLSHFVLRAGEAPRLLAFDDALGCPVETALAALEWTGAVGILLDDDLLHAARLTSETAAAVIERKGPDGRRFVYLGPRLDAPPMDVFEGAVLFDEPGREGGGVHPARARARRTFSAPRPARAPCSPCLGGARPRSGTCAAGWGRSSRSWTCRGRWWPGGSPPARPAACSAPPNPNRSDLPLHRGRARVLRAGRSIGRRSVAGVDSHLHIVWTESVE